MNNMIITTGTIAAIVFITLGILSPNSAHAHMAQNYDPITWDIITL